MARIVRYLRFRVDDSVFVEALESGNDNFIIIRTAGVLHAKGEQGQQLCEVDWSGSFVDHLVQFLLVGEFANIIEGGPQVTLADDAVLVVVHKLEGFLELSDLSLGEHGEDIGTRAFGLLGGALGALAGASGFGGWGGGGRGLCGLFLLLLLDLLFLVRL